MEAEKPIRELNRGAGVGEENEAAAAQNPELGGKCLLEHVWPPLCGLYTALVGVECGTARALCSSLHWPRSL